MTRAVRAAWTALGVNLAVILWGAFVRASGSGAGCGAHWPLCNGEVVPHSPQIATLIELTHRLTSGLALVAVVWLAYEAFRATPRNRSLRRAAVASVILILTEAALGAGLVLFQLVAQDESTARALFMTAHLVNTLLLLSALGLATHFARGGAPLDLRRAPGLTASFAASLLLLIAAGASGAIAALGDTLYPARALGDALTRDFSSTTHLLVRLRVIHPVLAIAGGLIAIGVARIGARMRPGADRIGILLIEILVTLQFIAGGLNVVLLAPIWMQIVHLFLADLVWLSVVVNAARAMAVSSRLEAARATGLAPATLPSR